MRIGLGLRNWAVAMKEQVVPSSRGGVDAPSNKYCRRHPLKGADGVVKRFQTTPSARSQGGSAAFLDRAATPPLEEGTACAPSNGGSHV